METRKTYCLYKGRPVACEPRMVAGPNGCSPVLSVPVPGLPAWDVPLLPAAATRVFPDRFHASCFLRFRILSRKGITVRSLHHRSVETWTTAENMDDPAMSRKWFAKAAGLEWTAALMLEPVRESEPTRAILFVSAASLLSNAGLPGLADRCARQGLWNSGSVRSRERAALSGFLLD